MAETLAPASDFKSTIHTCVCCNKEAQAPNFVTKPSVIFAVQQSQQNDTVGPNLKSHAEWR